MVKDTTVNRATSGFKSRTLHMIERDLYWLAGILEGEGSFMKGSSSKTCLPIISIQTTDQDVADRVAMLLGVKAVFVPRRQSHWKDIYSVRLHGAPAAEMMHQLRDLMSIRRISQIDVALASYKPKARRTTRKDAEQALILESEGKTQTQIGSLLGFKRETINKLLKRTKSR